jgi:2',3'-cyclic-nucleotide 2'-phosphodiesterase (5'-nucleotidase family)
VPGIDVIVGGHSHTLLMAPEVVGSTIIVQAGEHSTHLGVLNIAVKNGRITAFDGAPIPIVASMKPDPVTGAVGARLALYNQALSDKLAARVGATPVTLQGERADVRTRCTNLGNLVTDAMRSATNADIAITNGGGIRASIQAGDITVGHIYTVLPFDNTLVVLELTGDKILAALEHGVSAYPAQAGHFAHVSGLTFKFDPARPAGSRVTEVLVGGQPLNPYRYYTVATNDFMAAGGDGYTWFKEGKVLFNSGDMLRDVIAAYVSEAGTVTPSDEARIVPVK